MGLIILLLFSAGVIWFVLKYGAPQPAGTAHQHSESCCGGDIERKRAQAASNGRNAPKA